MLHSLNLSHHKIKFFRLHSAESYVIFIDVRASNCINFWKNMGNVFVNVFAPTGVYRLSGLLDILKPHYIKPLLGIFEK